MDIHDTPAGQAKRARQAAAERARRYRAAKREDGRPDTKAVDSAMAEAVSFLSSIAVPEIRDGKPTIVIDVAQLHQLTVINLVRDGGRRSYARAAVSSRMNRRSVHDQPHVIPSRCLTPHQATIERPVNGDWRDEEVGLIRRWVARWRDAVTRGK